MMMASIYDPFDPRRRMAAQGRMPARGQQRLPTIEDYRKLADAYREEQAYQKQLQTAYQELKSQLERQDRRVQELESENQIKSDALHAQGEDLKQAESELLWTRAALQQSEEARQEQQWQEKYEGLQAELESLRKRWEVRYQTQVQEERNRILLDMLPLADHLDLALQHANRTPDDMNDSLLENIRATQRAFEETMRRYGVERIAAAGKVFDPTLHEAIGQIESEDTAVDHIAEVVQAGYSDGDRILRPARVLVSSGRHAD